MSVKVKRIPNVFECLYLLARHDNYDPLKWRDILTGIYRKYRDRHSIKDVCLLYYSLFKAHTNNQISNLEIRYKDKENKEYLGPITIKDIAELYLGRVSELIKFMNTKQLAILSKYLLLFNKLNESICRTILLRISSNHLKITTRSFCNIVLALSESSYVNSDSIQVLLTQNKDKLLEMNRIDLMYILKSVSIHNINSTEILNIISDKLNYYTQEMSSNEILHTLYSIYRLNWRNESVINKLYFKIQNLIHEYNFSSLVLVCKCLSHFNLKDIGEFFNMELMPLVHRLEESKKLADSNKVVANTSKVSDIIKNAKEYHSGTSVDELLLFYRCCFNSGSTVYPKLLSGILSELAADYQWHHLFLVLHKYQQNINCSSGFIKSIVCNSRTDNGCTINSYNIGNSISSTATNDTHEINYIDTDVKYYVNLLLETVREFKRYIDTNKVNIKYLPGITKCMVESGFDRNEVLLEMIRRIELTDVKSTDYLVDILFNLHTVDFDDFNKVYEKLLRLILDNKNVCDYSYLVPIMTILFYRNIEIPEMLVSMFKSAFDNGAIQSEPWQISSAEHTNISSYKRHRMDLCDEALEYLLYSMVFPMKIGANSSDSIDTSDVGGSTNKNNALLSYKKELVCILKMIKKFERGDLLNYLLYYIGKMDVKLLKTLLDLSSKSSIGERLDVNRVVNDSVELELVESFGKPRDPNSNLSINSRLIIKFDGELLFKPCYVASGTNEVYYNKPSREKWDSVSINILRSVLELNSYNLLLI